MSETEPGYSSVTPKLLYFQSPWTEEDTEDRWLSQVEIVTHIGPGKSETKSEIINNFYLFLFPARRLWMGPQFLFRTFQHFGQK